jgi:CSLREA domain-containing protein
MATFTVTTLDDTVDASDGKLSLREALAAANDKPNADTVVFASALEGGKITLSGSQLEIHSAVTITGDSDHDGAGVTIDANGGSRVLEISGSVSSTVLDGLTITGGSVYGDSGGGIFIGENSTVAITHCAITDNSAVGGYDYDDGGEISTFGGNILIAPKCNISISNSTIAGGYATDAGGIAANGSTLTITNSEISGNNSNGVQGYIHWHGIGGGLSLARCNTVIS